ncbi:MAG: SDR family NAD(P)-dependent oxidoreductase [Flavobacteriaceae bacterium]|jgi:2-keto-3-deoxy-L-fuconate dehydrogenase
MGGFSLENKGALITGGGSGIGRAIAETFAAHNAIVHIIDTHKEAAEATLEAIESSGGKAFIHISDVTNYSQISSIIQEINNTHPIEILINNAGVAHVGTVETTDEAALDRLYEVNIKGVFNCTKACISPMKRAKKGVILNMGSIAGSVGINDRFAYSMTKGAVLAMTYSIAKDYVKYNIRCNSISPARVHTPFVDGFISKNYPGKEKEQFEKLAKTQPIGRMGTPHEIAQLALFLCSDESSFITGTDYPIDGGFIKLNGN